MPVVNEPLTSTDLELLRKAADTATSSRKNGNHPFGAILTDSSGQVVLTAENTVNTEHNDCGHAETNLMLEAVRKFDRDYLAQCTLVTTVEPCVMCAGAVYWGNVGRVVYGVSESKLLEMTGSNPENMTFDLPCSEVFSRGQKEIRVAGPAEDQPLIERIVRDHLGFWG